MKRLISGILILFALTASTVGCTPAEQQQTIVQITSALGTAVSTLLTIEGNTSGAAQLRTDMAAALTAETNWTSGTPAQDVVEALNVVQDDLNLLPVSTQDQAFIDLGIGLVDQILALLPAPTSAPSAAVVATPAVFRVSMARPRKTVEHRHPGLAKPILSAKDFKKRWNALIKQHPELAAAKVK